MLTVTILRNSLHVSVKSISSIKAEPRPRSTEDTEEMDSEKESSSKVTETVSNEQVKRRKCDLAKCRHMQKKAETEVVTEGGNNSGKKGRHQHVEAVGQATKDQTSGGTSVRRNEAKGSKSSRKQQNENHFSPCPKKNKNSFMVSRDAARESKNNFQGMQRDRRVVRKPTRLNDFE